METIKHIFLSLYVNYNIFALEKLYYNFFVISLLYLSIRITIQYNQTSIILKNNDIWHLIFLKIDIEFLNNNFFKNYEKLSYK